MGEPSNPQGGVIPPKTNSKSMEKVSGGQRGRSAGALALEMANALDSGDCFEAQTTQSLLRGMKAKPTEFSSTCY